jgi:hypothetical protein
MNQLFGKTHKTDISLLYSHKTYLIDININQYTDQSGIIDIISA